MAESKIDIEKILKKQREEYQRYLKIFSEDVNSKFKIIGEGISGILEGQKSIREMVAKNSEDIEIIKMDISFIKSGLKEKVDRDEFTALEKRVIFLENKYKRA
ncbi:MAG: hypothetical protein M1429_02755 [Patescibacteria group bacterium]|nr:hypothetical protein [Patescibacteria group bacterium]